MAETLAECQNPGAKQHGNDHRIHLNRYPGSLAGFTPGLWQDFIDVRGFVQLNYTPFEGDASFLAGPTQRTERVWETLSGMFPEEREKGVYDIDTKTPGRIDGHAAGYISDDDNVVVGLQTDAPLKRAMIPNGGWLRSRCRLTATKLTPS